MVIIDIESNTSLGGLTLGLDPAGMQLSLMGRCFCF